MLAGILATRSGGAPPPALILQTRGFFRFVFSRLFGRMN